MNREGVRIAYFARTALRGVQSSPVTSAIAVATIAVSLVLVGAFALLLHNMQDLVDRFGADLALAAYLEPGVEPAARAELERRILDLEGVEAVRLVSEAEALERFRAGVGRGADLLEGLDENPLPASFEITLASDWRSSQGMQEVAASLARLPGIADLSSGRDWVEGYLRAVALVRGTTIGLGVLLSLATLLIVANTIRLAVYARRDELEILSLVGASRSFVQIPFLLEGAIQGSVAGGLALLLLYAIFRGVLPGFEFGLELILGGVRPHFFGPLGSLAVVLGGAALGALGSASALAGGLRP